jgi:hypothetical protein
VECESTYDGTIIIRIYEYDSQIALYNGEFRDGVLEVKFPHAGIMFLRSNSNTLRANEAIDEWIVIKNE